MNYKSSGKQYLQTVLLVSDGATTSFDNSQILAVLNRVYLPTSSATKILSWVQEHQPDLIILDLELSQIIDLQLIAALRLDWLTRNIPILTIVTAAERFQLKQKLDYDACLIEPYSNVELDRAICSRLSNPACVIYRQAI